MEFLNDVWVVSKKISDKVFAFNIPAFYISIIQLDASGMQTQIIIAGHGLPFTAGDVVKIQHSVYMELNGTYVISEVFDSSTILLQSRICSASECATPIIGGRMWPVYMKHFKNENDPSKLKAESGWVYRPGNRVNSTR